MGSANLKKVEKPWLRENVAIKNSNRKWTMNLGGNPFHSVNEKGKVK